MQWGTWRGAIFGLWQESLQIHLFSWFCERGFIKWIDCLVDLLSLVSLMAQCAPFHVISFSLEVIGSIPIQTSPNCPFPRRLISCSDSRGISHTSLVLTDRSARRGIPLWQGTTKRQQSPAARSIDATQQGTNKSTEWLQTGHQTADWKVVCEHGGVDSCSRDSPGHTP